MIQNNNRSLRTMALLTGGVLIASATFQPAQAQTNNKEKLYKGGAAVLGVLGAYWILDGKTIPGAAAAAGAYYAYKKGQDVDNDDRYRYDDRYGRNENYRNDDYRYDDYQNDNYRYDTRNNDYRYDNRYPYRLR